MPEDDVAALEMMNLNYLEYPNTGSTDSCFINGCDPQKESASIKKNIYTVFSVIRLPLITEITEDVPWESSLMEKPI